MREIDVARIGATLLNLIEQASFEYGEAEREALASAFERESSETGRAVLGDLLENARLAREERRPLCQDTGVAVVFLDVGQDARLTGGDLEEAVQQSVAEGYRRFWLRMSMVGHPLERQNTGDNTPAIVHTRIVPGDRVRVRFDAKGGGCENMSRLAMLSPSAGREGVVRFVEETVRVGGGKPCPPLVVGVGLGGNFETCALIAKEVLLRPLGEPAENPVDAELEKELLERVNATGVGPMGLGGSATALAVHVASRPCHIASLPVAVNLDCHSHRHAKAMV